MRIIEMAITKIKEAIEVVIMITAIKTVMVTMIIETMVMLVEETIEVVNQIPTILKVIQEDVTTVLVEDTMVTEEIEEWHQYVFQ
jgi:hypothetical protein